MADAVITIKGVGDFSDVISNVNGVQKALTKLKLPDKLGDSLNKNITAFYKEYEKYQKKISEGIKTQGDYNQVEKSLNNMRNLYQAIGKDAQKLLKLDMEDMLNLDTDEFKKVSNEIINILKEIGNVKIDTKPFTKAVDDIRGVTKNSKISGENGILNQIMGSIQTGQISDAKKQIQELQNYANKVAPRTTANGKAAPGTLSQEKYQQLTNAINIMNSAIAHSEAEMDPLIQKHNELQKELEETKQRAVQGIGKGFKDYNEAAGDVEKVTDALKKMHQEEFSFNREAQNIDRQIQSYFGLSQMIRKVGDIAKDAFATVKELDKAMTETAVVTNFSVGDMWEMLPTYTQQANQLGSTIRDVYEAATLYYQQGLNTNQAMSLANETLKMARIAGLDAADATNMMTAALRGFNMEINQTSAQKVNDVYSELAAITASDTKEIGSAMERTASIANSANMDFATTSAFLAQMIETTREAPENLGTAMKTIVARFQEMKKDPTKLIDSEGVAMDANKVDTALKSIGVELMNTKGEFRDLDDVFLDISAKWDSLTQGQQRYIATIAAGSRQQSRFIAMMSDYDRTMELVDAANNSAGASQRQFEKTLDSMEAKLNKLKNAWDQFTMGLMNNQILKFGVNALTEGFTIVNKFIDLLSKIPPKPFEGITKSALTLATTLGMLQLGKKGSRGLVMGAASWWQKGRLDKDGNPMEGGFSKGFREGWGGSQANRQLVRNTNGIVKSSQFSTAIVKDINSGKITKAIVQQFTKAKQQVSSIPWSTAIAVNNLIDQSALDTEGKEAGRKLWNTIQQEVNQGTLKPELATIAFQNRFKGNIDFTQLSDEQAKVEQLAFKFDGLGTKISGAGMCLQQFGSILQGTPLEPISNLLTQIGMLLVTVGDAAVKAGRKMVTAFMEAKVAAKAVGGGLAGLKAGASSFLGAFTKVPPQLLLGLAALAVVAYGVYRAITADKRALEEATNAAAAASDAYDSAKQETSELADSISKIEETDSAFDNLVTGTAEFNEQLVTANEQIMELINKYPMLMGADKNYVTTDANGLMHLSKEGIKAVQDYQKEIQSRASAVNLIQTADLDALEKQQKVYQLLQSDFNDTKKHEQNVQEAQLLRERIKAEQDLAKTNAVRIALQNKELHNAEALTTIYSSQYEARKAEAEKEVKSLNKHEIRQQYADFHGYTYNKSNKTITDVEGNEIEYDDKVIKDELAEQKVLLTFEENAESLNSTLNNVDKRFAQSLDKTYESSDHFISDVLSKNINTNEDLLEQVLSSNSTQLEDAVNSMNEKEMAAILGISADAINSNNIDEKRDEIVQLLKNDAIDIVSTQVKSYEDLAAMMAQSQGWDTITAAQSENQKIIQDNIKALTAEQVHTMSNIGNQLKEGAGTSTMESYIGFMTDLYKEVNSTGDIDLSNAVKEIEETIGSVDLTSATGRLEAYTKMADSSSDAVRNLEKVMHSSIDEANLLGNAFDEFLGGDWLELSENADDFQNSLGQIDGAGILQAAEQSHTLKTMLDSGEVSASGLAMALQGIEDGKYSIGAVNESVLLLLSSLHRVEDEALKTHEMIENFDAGIDYGEASDFAKDNAEKAQEYFDNGEFGNQQLQNYIKLAAGQERWNAAIKEHHGDLELVEKDLLKYVTTFKDGFQPVIDQLTSGKGINGKALNDNLEQAVKDGKIDEALAEKFEHVKPRIEGDDFIFGTDTGKMANLTTEELKIYLEQIYGVSKEYADLILEEWTNLSPDLAAELSKNDLVAATEDGSFQESHAQDANGNWILTDQELNIIRDAGGEEAVAQIAENLNTTVEGLEKSAFHVLDSEGNRIDNSDDGGALLQSYIKKFDMAEKGSITSLLTTGKKTEEGSKLFTEDQFGNPDKLDLSKLMKDTIVKGMDETQAFNSAWQAYQIAQKQGETVAYEGVELDSTYQTPEEFQAGIDQAIESAKWEAIGEAIAQGMVNSLKGLLPDWMLPGQTTDNAPKEDTSPSGTLHNPATQKPKATPAEVRADAAPQKAVDNAQQTAQTLQKVGADNEQIKSAIIESAQKMADAQMQPEQIAAALNKAYGTNFDKSGKDITTNEDGKVAVNIDDTNLKEQLDGVEFSATANITNIVMHGGGSKGGAGKRYNPKASGQNNPNSVFHRHGTMARGSRKGYTISGRPTLTGEEGEELVWEPKRNQAYMVGSNGPQFANISKDAVVWNAEQTERIKKNSKVGSFGTGARGISRFGTMDGGTGSGMTVSGSINIGAVAEIQDVAPPAKEPTIPVKAELQVTNGTDGDLLDKVFGGGKNGPSVNVAANVTTIETTEQTKPVDVVGNITQLQNNLATNNINATATVTRVEKSEQVAGEPISVKATASVNKVSSGTAPKAQPKVNNQSMNVTANTGAAEAKIKKLISLFNKTYVLKYKASGPQNIKVPISANFTGQWTKKVTIEKAAKGKNNYIAHRTIPSFGSAARGRYGQLGPNGKGGLTLTGEKGFEIAWLPSENRSMILGASGPQMLNLPSDAVVYSHEQSEDILKQKSIPAGSHFRISQNNVVNGGGSVNSHVNKVADDVKKKVKETTDKISRVSNWWENIARQTEDSQRKMDQNQQAFQSFIKEMQATLTTTGTKGKGNEYIDSIGEYIGYNEAQQERAEKELNTLEKSGKSKKASQKTLKKAYNKGNVAIEQVSYTDKKGKSKTKFVDLSKYIKNGLVDDNALKKIKDPNKRKAVSEAANKAVNEARSRRNAAEDAIRKAQEALKQMGKELYETFFSWEIELTKIWNITQKIEQAQARKAITDAQNSLIDARIASGMQKVDSKSASDSISAFSAGLKQQVDIIKGTREAIEQNQKDIKDAVSGESVNQTLSNVTKKLNDDTSYDAQVAKRNAAKAAYDAVAAARARNKKIPQEEKKLREKIKKLENKNNKSKADKAALKKYKEQLKALDKEEKTNNQIIKEESQRKAEYEKQQSILNSMSGNLSSTDKLAYEAYQKALQDEQKVIATANKYMHPVYNEDGTVTIDFDTDAFAQAKEAGEFTGEFANKVQEYVKKINELNQDLANNYQKILDEATQLYTTLSELQEQWADAGDQLVKITEDSEKKKLDNLKKLSDSVKKALDDLLNKVKKALDDRRKLEDNAKTEQDISQKQQRLAALRADTSGGHQVEIAQLEKEIADAQRDYQRSLEDQLLEKLQEQGEEAARQRERQIELQEAISTGVNNLALVEMWMANPEDYEEEMRAAYRESNNYDTSWSGRQQQIDRNFDSLYQNILTNQDKQVETNKSIGEIKGIVESIEKILVRQNLGGVKGAYERGYSLTDAREIFDDKSLSEFKDAGYTAKDFSDSGISYKEARTAFSMDELKEYYPHEVSKELIQNKKDKYNTLLHRFISEKGRPTTLQALRDLVQAGEDLQYTPEKIGKSIGKKIAKKEYWRSFVDKYGFSIHKDKTLNLIDKAIRKNIKYKTGGLADFTGPAWLDGTPSKPELVLNARDTANFIALKDVLSSAMGSIGSTETSTYGDTTYEININVDKLTSDYDVDKVAERVKKIIVKDSSYRNVTQVRNLR